MWLSVFFICSGCSLLNLSQYNSSFPRSEAPSSFNSRRGRVTLWSFEKTASRALTQWVEYQLSFRPIRCRVNNRLPWQLVPWESVLWWNLTLTLTLIPLGIQMRCKWGRIDEYIKNKFIPVLTVFQIRTNYLTQIFLFFLFSSFFSFWFSLFHSCSGAFSPSDLAPWKGSAPSAWRAPDFLVLPPQRRLPFWGALALAQILPEEKQPSPERVARNPPRVEQVVLFQVDHKHRQEFRQSSFPFLERTFTGSPSEYKRFPPTGEKPQDPWGPSQAKPRLCSQRDESRRAWSIDKLRDRTRGYRFRHHHSCGTRIWKWRQDKEVYMLRPRTAHARRRRKSKSKREIRTMAARSSCKRLTVCANRALSLDRGGIIDLSWTQANAKRNEFTPQACCQKVNGERRSSDETFWYL